MRTASEPSPAKTEPPGRRATNKPGVLNNLQVVRGLAAMLVVLAHANVEAVEYGVWDKQYFYFGGSGVDIFFAVSGFIMVLTTHHIWGARQEWWRGFFKRRLTRIVPMYWLITSVKLAIVLLVPSVALHSSSEPWYVISSYLFIPSLNSVSGEIQPLLTVGWTLNYEMLFYTIFAAGIALTARPMRLIFPALIAASVIGLWRNNAWAAPATLFDPILLEFLLGACVALATLNGLRLPPWSALIVLVLMLAALPLLSAIDGEVGRLTGNLWRVILLGVPGALVVFAAVSLEGSWWTARAGSLAVLVGGASYAIYLTHQFVTPVFGRVFLKLGLVGPVAAASLIVTACISAAVVGILVYWYVETPMLALFRSRNWQFAARRPIAFVRANAGRDTGRRLGGQSVPRPAAPPPPAA
jgi:exopolysaccharide production protein ExoZ